MIIIILELIIEPWLLHKNQRVFNNIILNSADKAERVANLFSLFCLG